MRLKCLARTGWMQRGVPPSMAETVAAHSFEAALLAYIIAVRIGVSDPYKASLAALLHDAAETLVGDIPLWSSEKMKELKDLLEEQAFSQLGMGEEAAWLLEDPLKTIVRVADLLATALQARRYVASGYSEVEEIYRSSKQMACTLVEEKLRKAGGLVEELLGEPC